MSLVDEVERLGALASQKAMTTREAAHELKRLHSDLTIPGALELIRNWKDVRAHYNAP